MRKLIVCLTIVFSLKAIGAVVGPALVEGVVIKYTSDNVTIQQVTDEIVKHDKKTVSFKKGNPTFNIPRKLIPKEMEIKKGKMISIDIEIEDLNKIIRETIKRRKK